MKKLRGLKLVGSIDSIIHINNTLMEPDIETSAGDSMELYKAIKCYQSKNIILCNFYK